MPPHRTHPGGFTLVEVLVSVTIVSILLLLLVSMTDVTRRAWTTSAAKVEQFRDAREAFESITRRLSQATLNTYWDYHYDSAKSPDRYIRQSELRFLCDQAPTLLPSLKDASGGSATATGHAVFFQAPLGYVDAPTSGTADYRALNSILNTCGYFIAFGSDKPSWPPFLQSTTGGHARQERYRFRLMELVEPSNALTLYGYTSGTNADGTLKAATYTGHEWFAAPIAASPAPVRAVAENIVAIVILPRLTSQEDATGTKLAPQYRYDSTFTGEATSLSGTAAAAVNSKNQLPPIVQVTMVAVDEASYARFQETLGASFPSSLGLSSLFQSAGDLHNTAAAGFAQDLQTLQNTLQSHRINYRVFTTNIAVNSAKWSREQTD